MIKLHKKLKDPKCQAFAQWNVDVDAVPRGRSAEVEFLDDFIKQNKIPKKYKELVALALTVVRWSTRVFGVETATCSMCVFMVSGCSGCLVRKICAKRFASTPANIYRKLYTLYKKEYEEEFGKVA